MLLTCATPDTLAVVPREGTSVGTIVVTKGDEQLRLVTTPDWLAAEVHQDLLGGDALRTGRYGGLAILFQDRTQIRVHANSQMIIKGIPAAPQWPWTLRLERGAVWSRARPSDGDGLRMETPAATLAIRGTDWAVQVEDSGFTRLIVLAGVVEMANAFGSVTVGRGEAATVAVGRAPVKTFLLNPQDRPQWQLEIGLGWLDLFPVTGQSVAQLRERWPRLEQALAQTPAPQTLLDLAEVSFDLGDYTAAHTYLARLGTPPSRLVPRVQRLEGLLRLRARDFDAAAALLAQAAPRLQGREALLAELGRVAVQVETRQYPQAEASLDQLQTYYAAHPDVHLALAWLRSFRGAYQPALQDLTAAQRRFPEDARFPALLGHLYLLTGQNDALAAAVGQALTLDPSLVPAWELKGLLHQQIRAEPWEAIRAYRQILDRVPNHAAAWSGLGVVYTALGYYREAEDALRRAIDLDPLAAGALANYASLLLSLERPDEAIALLDRALELDPGHAGALQDRGVYALSQGDMAAGNDWLFKATTAHPGLANAGTLLGIAQYQQGNRRGAEQSLETARRLDPHDPIPDLINSVIAQEHFEPGQAIRHARSALDKYLAWDDYTAEGLASDRSGIINVGSAYANLGLREWGDYYAQLSFDPYWANSHFGVAALYESANARRGAEVQGLLLDPLAYANRSRYTDFFRRPFHDPRLLAGLEHHGQGTRDRAQLAVQGFLRDPYPLSYAVGIARTDDDGHLANGHSTREDLVLNLGVKLDEANSAGFGLSAARIRAGLPGPEDQPPTNERSQNEGYEAVLGYQHRFGPRNRLLARAASTYRLDETHNPDPFGTGLSDLEFSLLSTFGLGQTRLLYEAGLYDASPLRVNLPFDPLLVAGPLGAQLGLTLLEDNLPTPLDPSPLHEFSLHRHIHQLQFRHLFDLGPLEMTYGADGVRQRAHQRVDLTAFDPIGTGAVTVDGVQFFPFPFGNAATIRLSTDYEPTGIQAYLHSRWKMNPDLWLEGGVYVRRFEDGAGARATRSNPRLGLAWRPTPQHWLRLTLQQDLFFQMEGQLAPVATVGLVPSNDLLTEGEESSSVQLRWDAEWNPRLFTFAQIDRQHIEPRAVSLPLLGERRLHRATVGVNLWLGERLGLGARYRHIWGELLTAPYRGNSVPLFPDELVQLDMTYVDPRQFKVSLLQSYEGERSIDLTDSRNLEGYWLTHINTTWESSRRHWSLSLGVRNLFDQEYETLPGFPAPGRTFVMIGEYRF